MDSHSCVCLFHIWRVCSTRNEGPARRLALGDPSAQSDAARRGSAKPSLFELIPVLLRLRSDFTLGAPLSPCTYVSSGFRRLRNKIEYFHIISAKLIVVLRNFLYQILCRARSANVRQPREKLASALSATPRQTFGFVRC